MNDLCPPNILFVGAFKGVATETGFEPLPPGERVKRFAKGGQVKKRELTTKGIQGCVYLLRPFGFGFAGIDVLFTHIGTPAN